MRFSIIAITAFTIAASSGCVASEPGKTSELNQAVVQSCAVAADCSAFADNQCLANQVGACAQAGTASAHCVCVKVPNPSNPGPGPGSGPTCWDVLNACIDSCDPGDWGCEDSCDVRWATCGF